MILKISLREYLEQKIGDLGLLMEQRIASVQKLMDAEISSSRTALLKADETLEKRLDALNGSRATFNDLLNRMMPRVESEQRHVAAREKIDLMVQRSEAQGHWKTFADKQEQLDNRLNRIEGAGMGVRGAWVVIVAVTGTMIALFSVFFR